MTEYYVFVGGTKCHGGVRNKIWSLILALNQNIESFDKLYVEYYGYVDC